MPTKPLKAAAAPVSNDYNKLILAEFPRKETWRPSLRWKENRSDLLRYVHLNCRDQVALTAAEMAAEELGVNMPAVRAWRGDEQAAERKLGWYSAAKPWEINVTLDQHCQGIANTSGHEIRHAWQFKHFPNLTREQQEKDANEYAKDFIERAFDRKVA